MNYLSDKHKKSDWYPTELKERARVDEYNNWQHLNLRGNGSMLFQTKVNEKLHKHYVSFWSNLKYFRLSFLVLNKNHQMIVI